MASRLPVLIIGGGLAGLTLARSLLKSNIPAIVFDSAVQGRSPGYGLVLQQKAYKPLLSLLNLEEAAFRKSLAVDAALGGTGSVSGERAKYAQPNTTDSKTLARLNRRRLRDLLAEGVEVRWEHKLKRVETADGSVRAEFENGDTVDGSLLVAADGVHSSTRRQFLPDVKPDILPVVAVNGQRRIERDTFDKLFLPLFMDNCVAMHRDSNRMLSVTINDSKPDLISMSWVYSRPAGKDDPVFKPDRPLDEAKIVPDELFEEFRQLSSLPQPFAEIFDADKAKNDKLLNWLMRSVKISDADLQKLPRSVCLIGDALHAAPIVVGEGGCHAILDGIELAEQLSKDLQGGYNAFLRQSADRWRSGIASSESNLVNMHRESHA